MKKLFFILLLVILLCMCSIFVLAENKPYEGQEVNVLVMATGPYMDFGNLIGDFEKNTGAKVNYISVGEKNYDTKAELELVTKKGSYDVIWVPWRRFGKWTSAGLLEPLDEYIDAEKKSEILKMEGFSPKALNALSYNGKQMALPTMMDGMILLYRTDIFKKYGIEKPPDTWKEVMEIAKKINSPEVAAIGMRGSKAGGGVGFVWPMILKAFGGSIVKDYPNDMHPTLDQPIAIEAAEYYKELLSNYGFEGAETSHWLECATNFQQGRVAMYPSAAVLTGQILDPEKSTVIGKVGFAQIPQGDADRVSAGSVHGLGIPKNAQNKKLGFKFIEWALSERTQMANVVKNDSSTVSRPGLMLTPEYLKKYNWRNGEWARVVSENFEKYFDPLYRPMSPEWGEVEENIGIAMSKVLSGQESADKALPEANKKLYEIYKEAGYYDK